MEKKAPCADEGIVHSGGRTKTSGQETVERMSLRSERRSKKSSEEALEAMPKTIKRTLSGSETAPPFHQTGRISLNYCAAYFFRKDGVCVALAYLFPGRVRRLFLPQHASSTLEAR